jgi:hypothetical protein
MPNHKRVHRRKRQTTYPLQPNEQTPDQGFKRKNVFSANKTSCSSNHAILDALKYGEKGSPETFDKRGFDLHPSTIPVVLVSLQRIAGASARPVTVSRATVVSR